MKQFLTTTFLIFAFCSLLTAQTVEVTWGKEKKSDKQQDISEPVYSDESGYVFVVTSSSGMSKIKREIIKHDLDHHVVYKKPIKLERNGKDYTIKGIRKLKDHMVIFATLVDKKLDKHFFYAAKIDLEGNQGEFELIDEVATIKNNSADYSITVSESDGRFLLVRLNPYDKKGTEKFSYKVFDQDFKMIWEKDVDLEYKDKEFTVEGYELDAAGNVFLMGKKLTKVKREELSNFKIYSYQYKTDKLTEIPLDFKRIYGVQDLFMFIKDNKLQVSGFFAKDKKSGLSGVLMYKINCTTLEIENEKNITFNKQDIAKLQTKSQQKKDKGISFTYDISDVLIRDDGSYTILAEQFFIREIRTQTRYGVTIINYQYYYNNILAINVTSEGEINWFTIVPKIQVSLNDGGKYSSFMAITNGNNLHLLYNSNPKNTSPKKKKADKVYLSNMSKAHKAVAVMATINDKGELSQEELFKSRNKDDKSKAILRPKFSAKLKTGETLILAIYGKSYKFGMISIK